MPLISEWRADIEKMSLPQVRAIRKSIDRLMKWPKMAEQAPWMKTIQSLAEEHEENKQREFNARLDAKIKTMRTQLTSGSSQN